MNRLPILLTFCCIVLNTNVTGKQPNPNTGVDISGKKYWRSVFDNRIQHIGLGFGIDNALFGAQYQTSYPIISIGKSAREVRESRIFTGAFVGTRVHLFGLYAIWGGADLNAGISLGPLTLEQNINWNFIAGEGGSRSLLNSAFKLGIHVRPVWLKMGVNLWTSRPDDTLLELVTINKRLLIFSLLFRIDTR